VIGCVLHTSDYSSAEEEAAEKLRFEEEMCEAFEARQAERKNLRAPPPPEPSPLSLEQELAVNALMRTGCVQEYAMRVVLQWDRDYPPSPFPGI
jgi:hypothetical protein